MLHFFKKSLLNRYLDLYASYQKYADNPEQLKKNINHFLDHLSPQKLQELVGYLKIDFARLHHKFHELHLDSNDKEQVSRDLSDPNVNKNVQELKAIQCTAKNLQIELAFYKPFADGLIVLHDALAAKVQLSLEKVSKVNVSCKQ